MVHGRGSLTLAGCFAVLGFLLVTAASTTDATRKAAAPRRAQLVDLIESRRRQVVDLDADVRALRDEVAETRQVALQRTRQDAAEAERSARLAVEAGTVALKGKGLLVKLSDSERDPKNPSGELRRNSGAYRIHDSDIQLVVNALFAAGAEAVSVNDSRLVATSPIRAAGDTIVVNFRPLNPPYRVTAIGVDKGRFDDSAIVARFKRWTRLFGLGFSVSEREVEVPAFTGRVAITSARPAGGV
jgi:uncharacterized protein YlxW (UPF0749 family)